MTLKTQSVCEHCHKEIKPCWLGHISEFCEGWLHMSNYHACEDGLHRAEPASTGEPKMSERKPNTMYCDKCNKEMPNLALGPCSCGSSTFSGTMVAGAARPSEPSAPECDCGAGPHLKSCSLGLGNVASQTRAELAICWLIEANGKYWTAADGMCTWTDDPWKAVRFYRREDADRVRLTATASKVSMAIEHAFEEVSGPSAPQPAGKCWKCEAGIPHEWQSCEAAPQVSAIIGKGSVELEQMIEIAAPQTSAEPTCDFCENKKCSHPLMWHKGKLVHHATGKSGYYPCTAAPQPVSGDAPGIKVTIYDPIAYLQELYADMGKRGECEICLKLQFCIEVLSELLAVAAQPGDDKRD